MRKVHFWVPILDTKNGPKIGTKNKNQSEPNGPRVGPNLGAKRPPKSGPKGATNWVRVGLSGVPSGLARSSDSGQGLAEVAELHYQFVLGQPNMRSLANWAKVTPRATFEIYRAKCLYEAMSELFLVIAYIRINTV